MAIRCTQGNSGFTLVEVLLSGTIGGVLIAGIFTSFGFIGTVTEQTTSMQQLGSECAFIDDYVSKWVNQGNYATVGANTVISGTTDTATDVTIRDAGGNAIKTFYLSADSLMEDSVRLTTPYLASHDTGSVFVVDATGRFVEFTYRLRMDIQKRAYFYPRATLVAPCKNMTTF